MLATPVKAAISLVLLLAVANVIKGCSSTDHYSPDSPPMAAALDDQPRMVTVYLVPDRVPGFVPVYIDRVVYAERVIASTQVRAEAVTDVQGINTVIVGDNCETLNQLYANLQECKEVDSVSRQYGPIETTAVTDAEGFATFSVGSGPYRVSMESWVTAEDQKCSWSGSVILPEEKTTIELPVLVFCE